MAILPDAIFAVAGLELRWFCRRLQRPLMALHGAYILVNRDRVKRHSRRLARDGIYAGIPFTDCISVDFRQCSTRLRQGKLDDNPL